MLTVTDHEFAELSRRVSALELSDAQNSKSIEFIASTLGGMKAVQDNHTKRLDRLETDMRDVKADMREVKAELREVRADIKGLRADLPAMLAAAVKEGLAR